MRLALIYRTLSDVDFRVLRAIERYMKEYEYVPVEVLEAELRLSPTRFRISLSKLNSLKLIVRLRGAYTGYMLTFRGLDCLALRGLVLKGVLSALGDKIGVGKESDVYGGISGAGEKVTVKIHRVGRTSFRQTRRYRTYTVGKPRISWLEESKIAASREFEALTRAYEVGVRVPRPIGRDRHIVVTSLITGVPLIKIRELKGARDALLMILEDIRKAYVKARIVHGDLSEYNVLIDLDLGEPVIIDWPQYVDADHEEAERLLRRDVEYIVKFFLRRYGVKVNLDKAIAYVKGEIEDLE